MEVDLVRIAVAIEIAPEHDSIFVRAGDRRQLGLERGALDLTTATERFGERKAVELGQVLQIARLMRGESTAHERSAHQQDCDSYIACAHHSASLGAQPRARRALLRPLPIARRRRA
jgi:hypothetical protein